METPRPLTRRQKEILDFIAEFHAREGIPPTHREICEAFGYSSYGTVHKHLRLLREKGYLERDWNQKRGLRLVRPSSGDRNAVEDVPFFGTIAAGRPIEVITGDEHLGVPDHLLAKRSGHHYVLRVTGDSMIEEGIHDGDFVVVLGLERADPGDMVVALIGDEATLKRFYPEGATVRLEPAHPTMQPIRVPAKDVRIQGIVVGLMRRF